MPTTTQLGSVFQAAVRDGVVLALSVIGRWLATINHRSSSDKSWAKELCTVSGFQERLGVALWSARVTGNVQDAGWVGDVEC